MFDFFSGWFCQTLLLTSFVYSIYDIYGRSKQHLMNFAHRAWWAALDVYITADEFYNARMLPAYNAVVLSKDMAVVNTYDTVGRITNMRLPRSIRQTVVGYVDSCRERILAPIGESDDRNEFQGSNPNTTATDTGAGVGGAPSTILNPFISVSVQLTSDGTSGGTFNSVMNDIIIPNEIVQRYCIPNTYMDADLIDYMLHMHCKHLLNGRDIASSDLSSLTLLDNDVNISVLMLHGPTAKSVRFEEGGGFTIVNKCEITEEDETDEADEADEADVAGAAETQDEEKSSEEEHPHTD
jgi:hypothetical protein